jgi:hypothetical protein
MNKEWKYIAYSVGWLITIVVCINYLSKYLPLGALIICWILFAMAVIISEPDWKD